MLAAPPDALPHLARESRPAAATARPLPLLTLYFSERCNSRCVSCDYWRHGSRDLSLDAVTAMLPGIAAARTEMILVSGGEPLVNPAWREIATLLRANGLRLWLLTAGLALAKHADAVARLFERVTVSMDGSCATTYERIRGLDAFDVVCDGVRAMAARGVEVSLRVTLQRDNYRELPAFVALAQDLGAHQVSFLAADVANPEAFGRAPGFTSDLALGEQDLHEFARLLDDAERQLAPQFASGVIAESPAKLRRLLQYYTAVRGLGEYPAVRCNAPEFSAVVEAGGHVRPCFFIRGPAGNTPPERLADALNDGDMDRLRATIRNGGRDECRRCVCSAWREPGASL